MFVDNDFMKSFQICGEILTFVLFLNAFLCLPFLVSSATSKSLVPPDPPEEGNIEIDTMKLADVESEDARERLRASNLDDLEKAFKYEIASESHDGTSTNDDRFPFIPMNHQVSPMPQASGDLNMMSFAPTSQINVPQAPNTFDLAPDPEPTLKRNEDDTIETLVVKAEEDKQEKVEMDISINDTFQNEVASKVPTEEKSDHAQNEVQKMNMVENKSQPEVQIDDQTDEEDQIESLKQDLKNLFQPIEEIKEEQAKQEIKSFAPERSVKFSLPTNQEMGFEEEGHEEKLDPFPNQMQQNSALYGMNRSSDNYDLEQNTIYEQNRSFPARNSTSGVRDSYSPMPPMKEKSKPILVINGSELTSPKRKTCLGFLLLVGAAIGLVVSMTNPPRIAAIVNNSEPNYDPCIASKIGKASVFTEINGTIKCAVPTVSPAPTKTHVPTINPTISRTPTASPIKPNIYDSAYASVQRLIVESQVSPLHTLPKECYLPLCSAGVNENQEVTLQQKTVHYLLTQDQIFFSWVGNNSLFAHAERVLQRYILTLMAFSLSSKDWTLKQNWPVENGFVASISECNWFGLTCGQRAAYINLKDFVDHTYLAKSEVGEREVEVTDMVTKIVLRNNALVGDLPQEVFKLRHLEEIKLHHNEISGTLPKSIGLLSNLQKLWLHDTGKLSGTIPETIGNLTTLNSMWIGLNKFEGPIPKEIGKLTNLQTIGFLANSLTGTIPSELLQLKKLKNLYLDINNFQGSLPELGQLRELRDLRIDTNNLDGTLPSSLSELKMLKNFYAYKNNFRGELPNSLVVGWESLG